MLKPLLHQLAKPLAHHPLMADLCLAFNHHTHQPIIASQVTVELSPFALSKKERVVAQHIVTGASNQEIAETLCVSLSTIKTHTQNIYSKLGVNKRLQAIEMLLKLNLAS